MPRATWIKNTLEMALFRRPKPMPATLLPSFLSKSAPKDAIPYSSEAIRQDLVRVRVAWEGAQSSRDRDAIYGYLTAVFALVTWWSAEGREIDRARRALLLQRLKVSDREDPFAAIIRCTADPPRPTSEPGASGRDLCGTRRRTSRIPSPWISSSDERVASTNVLTVSQSASGEVRQPGRRDVPQEGDELMQITLMKKMPILNKLSRPR
jgi:hypothetical protein